MPDAPTDTRADYAHWLAIPTRWMDNDVYGHVNNVTYYSYFDTVVNEHLIAAGVLDVETPTVFGVVVETGCRFLDSLTFPEVVEAGLRVAQLGTTSVALRDRPVPRRAPTTPAAVGHFVHVYVDRADAPPRPRSRTASERCLSRSLEFSA